MADLLSEGKIIGTVRGRTEFGPRALGHRSLLAFPTEGMKDRMNRLKVREWFRPVAPVFTYEVSCDADAIIRFNRPALCQWAIDFEDALIIHSVLSTLPIHHSFF